MATDILFHFDPKITPPDFNNYPLGWREIPEHEFAQYLTQGGILKIEFRQMFNRWEIDHWIAGRGFTSAHLLWKSDQTGWGMVADPTKGRIRYFRFGCEHRYRKIKQVGRCASESVCDFCGHHNITDSSD